MRIQKVRKFTLSRSDLNIAKETAHLVINHVNDDADMLKLCNTLMNDRVIMEDHMARIQYMLRKAIVNIENKVDELNKEYDVDNLPEKAAGEYDIIQRPREMFKMIIDNYGYHTRKIYELIELLTTDTYDEEDEEDLTASERMVLREAR